MYGPGQRKDSLIPTIIQSLIHQKNLSLKNRQNRLDYIYVSDVSAAIIHLVESKEASGFFNVGSGKSTSISYIEKRIHQLLHHPFELIRDLNGSEAEMDFYADISRIKNTTGWVPEVMPDQGLKKTALWQLSQNSQKLK